MRIIKLNEMNKDIDPLDPFGEEDWDEKELFLYALNLWIGVRTGRSMLKIYHVHKRLIDEDIIFTINGATHKNKLDIYQSIISDKSYYTIHNKMIIFDINKVDNDLISNEMKHLIDLRISTSNDSIDRFINIQENDGYDEEEEESFDLDKIEIDLEREMTIKKNLEFLKSNVSKIVNNEINKIKY